MKNMSAGLKAHYQKGSTTVVKCWKVTRTDGVVFGFTEYDSDFTYDGVRYEAPTGFIPASQVQSADMAVANSEINGVLGQANFPTLTAITEADIIARVWDGVTVVDFELDIEDRSLGIVTLAVSTTGDISTTVQTFKAETRGITQALQQTVGRVYAAPCDEFFGGPRCGYDVASITVTGTITSVTNRSVFRDSARVEAADWFGAGLIRWLTGLNAGREMEIRDYANTGTFTLHQAMASNVSVGDTYEAVPGCRKRMLADCRDKWDWIDHFQGFDLPLNDDVIGNAGVASA